MLTFWNIHWKYKIFSLQTVFALISTVFVRWSCNFTQSSTIYVEFFHILLTNILKCLEKIYFTRQSKSLFFRRKLFDSVQCKNCIFSRHFQRLINKIWKIFTCMGLLRVKLQLRWTKIVEMRAKTARLVTIWYFQCIFFKS